METTKLVLTMLGFLFFLFLLVLACLPSAAVRSLVRRFSAKKPPRS